MIYVAYEDLCRDIRENLTKIPRDVCGVVGVPRSGMLPATIIAEYLNVPLIDIRSLQPLGNGGRRMRPDFGSKILVVEDTCFHGNSLSAAKRSINELGYSGKEFEFLAVYLEGPCDRDKPDIYLRDIREEAKGGPFGWALYEWNIFAHGRLTDRTLFDMDGVICVEPPDERDTEAYEAYIKKPTPLYVPTGAFINVCTYRLEKYRDITEQSLRDMGICPVVHMASDRITPAWKVKAEMYKEQRWMLFVESSEWQARRIYEETGKPVFCVQTNELYG